MHANCIFNHIFPPGSTFDVILLQGILNTVCCYTETKQTLLSQPFFNQLILKKYWCSPCWRSGSVSRRSLSVQGTATPYGTAVLVCGVWLGASGGALFVHKVLHKRNTFQIGWNVFFKHFPPELVTRFLVYKITVGKCESERRLTVTMRMVALTQGAALSPILWLLHPIPRIPLWRGWFFIVSAKITCQKSGSGSLWIKPLCMCSAPTVLSEGPGVFILEDFDMHDLVFSLFISICNLLKSLWLNTWRHPRNLG